MINKMKIGLSLSGGGYRAAAYHLGTLRKLNELGVLQNVDVISTVSGGSITGAYYGLYGKDFDRFDKGLITGLKSSVIKSVLTSRRFIIICLASIVSLFLIFFLLFTKFAWASFVLLSTFIFLFISFQFKIFPVSRIIEKIYDDYFFLNKTLHELRNDVVIAINSTNLETGRLFTFSKNKMNDSSYEFPGIFNSNKPIHFKHNEFPISRAVMASSCVPFAFSPVVINSKYFKEIIDSKKINPRLVDGGVYDNQGIHKITQKNSSYECDVIITSDAGNIMPYRSKFNNTIKLLTRTSEVFMNRIKNFQLIQNFYNDISKNKKEIAYQSLGWDIENSIPEFIRNLKNGLILDRVLDDHKISKKEIDEGKWDVIKDKLEKSTRYSDIIINAPSKRELNIARSVKTNLTALRDEQINALVKQARAMTELHIRLYCPSIIIK